jgi:hypothetical protein
VRRAISDAHRAAAARRVARARVAVTLGAATLLLAGCRVGTQQGYAPEQPIAFSHATHAGLYEIDCQYCHSGAERSRHAGVPAASVCLNCHAQVKVDSPEIRKLAALVRTDAPVRWTRVHRLPDFAFFSHASHVSAGLACQSCHGDVQTMVRVQQRETMSMGWCIRCHRDIKTEGREAPVPLATIAINRLPEIEKSPPRHLQPPTDCSACHR